MKNRARELRWRLDASINAVQKLIRVDELSPEEFEIIIDVYESFKIDFDYKVGVRFRDGGKLYEVIQAHTSQEGWIPSELPALYKVVSPSGVIPEWMQPAGAHDSYQKGDRVIFEGEVYESEVDNNIWKPGTHGWVKKKG